MDTILLPTDPEITMLRNNKQGGYDYRYRRHDNWTENYELYRDKVITNRLTQRQSVNLPLMKSYVRTLLKDVDDIPNIYFENLDNNKDAEILKNEHWKYTGEKNKFEIQDIVDKKQVFLFGRGFDQWQILKGMVKMTLQDPIDILISQYTDPIDLHSSRFLTHTHIFVPLSTLEQNPDYDKQAIAELKQWFGTEMGLIKSATNYKTLIDKNKKMEDMGVLNLNSPILGETYVEISLNFAMRDREIRKGKYFENQIFLYVDAEDMKILMKKPLEEVIGPTKDHFWQTHYPYNSWGDDIERQDFWSDGVADIIRTPNKILNSFFSQMVENRTLRNFGMRFFDATIEGFVPPSNQDAIPGGWYPLPGKPSDVFENVEVPDLSDSLDEINFLVGMMEKATGATATQQGVQTEKKITLGEVELALGEAKERIKGMSKFYTPAWKERGLIFEKLCEAAPDKLDMIEINKKGRNTDNMYTRKVGPKDYQTPAGYNVRIWSQDEKNEQDTKQLEKLNAVGQFFMGNSKFEEIRQQKYLEFAGMNPDQINDIMEVAKQQRQAALLNPMNPGGVPTPQPVQPVQTK